MISLGGVYLFDNLNIKADIALFKTTDENKNIFREHPTDHEYWLPAGTQDENGDTTYYSFPIKESAKYIQYTIQIEKEIPGDIRLITQISGSEIKDHG